MNGVIFYEGPSKIDGQPIVAIATFKTGNEKTGQLIQTWILRKDYHPIDAINTGHDASICGTCPLRGRIASASERIKPGNFTGDTANKDRSCYVLVQNAPSQVWGAYKRGKYEFLSIKHSKLFRNKGLRLGSYGDPVAVPKDAWDYLNTFVKGSSKPGYTHQWRSKKFKAWSTKLMASTHSLAENEKAQAAGWRTFRTIASVDQLAHNEILCPASEEGGYKKTCESCNACNGRRDMDDQRRNVAIVAHGSGGKATRLVQLQVKLAAK
jgi:hypothetical protein